jgi:hypothetical protein
VQNFCSNFMYSRLMEVLYSTAEQLAIVQTPEDGDFCQTDWLSVDSCVPEGGSRFCGNLTGSTCEYS